MFKNYDFTEILNILHSKHLIVNIGCTKILDQDTLIDQPKTLNRHDGGLSGGIDGGLHG